MLRSILYALSVCTVGLLLLAGCSSQPSAEMALSKHAVSDEHEHKPATHGGMIVPLGRDSYHAEVVFEKSGQVRLYTLGRDETIVLEVEAQPLSAFAKVEGDREATSIELRAEPQAGDSGGKTSQFVGTLPRELLGKKMEITIPSLRIGEDRFRVHFAGESGPHADSTPAREVSAAKERELFLTAGGKYTQADIAANGNQTGAQKFKNFTPSHDLKPNVGDKICPITLTKANPQCTWIIDGKVYEFCCPPCVEEFVELAKTKPEELKEPESYRKR